jgi:hypothetical protein
MIILSERLQLDSLVIHRAVLEMAKTDPAGREYTPAAFVFGSLGERVKSVEGMGDLRLACSWSSTDVDHKQSVGRGVQGRAAFDRLAFP